MYAFTNQFSGSVLLHRVRMINRRHSGPAAWVRYAVVLTLTVGAAFTCQLRQSEANHRYIRQTDDGLFALITSRSSPADLDTLRRVLGQRGIGLNYDHVDTLPDGQIQQIALSVTVPRPGHAIHTSVGSPYGRAPIPAIGLHLKHHNLSVSGINDQFPAPLQKLAARDDKNFSQESDRVKLVQDANSVFGFYRTFYRNDFMESNYFGLRTTLVRMTPDYHLDLYPEFINAVVFLDGNEISRKQLRQFHVLDLKKLVVYQGNAAKLRYGNRRAQQGLVLLSSRQNQYVRNYYGTTALLKEVYPELFANY